MSKDATTKPRLEVTSHRLNEGVVYFPAAAPPQVNQCIKLPSDGSEWVVYSVNADELKLIVKPT